MSQKPNLVQCPYCPKQVLGVSSVKMHITTKHPDKPMPETFSPADLQHPPTSPDGHIISKHVQPDEHGNLPCPECKELIPHAKHKPNYKRLGRHRRFAHNIIGFKHFNETPKQTSNGKRAANGSAKTFPSGRRIGRPRKSQSTERGLIHVPHSPVIEIAATTESALSQGDIAYALAVGSIKEFCRNFAEEHDIPTKLFTRSVAELFLRQARR